MAANANDDGYASSDGSYEWEDNDVIKPDELEPPVYRTIPLHHLVYEEPQKRDLEQYGGIVQRFLQKIPTPNMGKQGDSDSSGSAQNTAAASVTGSGNLLPIQGVTLRLKPAKSIADQTESDHENNLVFRDLLPGRMSSPEPGVPLSCATAAADEPEFPWCVYVPRKWSDFRSLSARKRDHENTSAATQQPATGKGKHAISIRGCKCGKSSKGKGKQATKGSRRYQMKDHDISANYHFFLFRKDATLTSTQDQYLMPQDPHHRVRLLWNGNQPYIVEKVELKNCSRDGDNSLYVSADLKYCWRFQNFEQQFLLHIMTDFLSIPRKTSRPGPSLYDDSTITTLQASELHAWWRGDLPAADPTTNASPNTLTDSESTIEDYVEYQSSAMRSQLVDLSLRNTAPSDIEPRGLSLGLDFVHQPKWKELAGKHQNFLENDYILKSVRSSYYSLTKSDLHTHVPLVKCFSKTMKLVLAHAENTTLHLTEEDLIFWHRKLLKWKQYHNAEADAAQENHRLTMQNVQSLPTPQGVAANADTSDDDFDDPGNSDAATAAPALGYRTAGVRCGECRFMDASEVPDRMAEFVAVVNAMVMQQPVQKQNVNVEPSSASGSDAAPGVTAIHLDENKNANPSSSVHEANPSQDTDMFSRLSAVGKAAFICYHFIRIHPFVDGNGRLGRLLAMWALCRLQFPLYHVRLCAPGSERDRFIAAMRDADRKEGRPVAVTEHIGACVRELCSVLEDCFPQ
ncbi:unnamed protein product [Amoebophrya sp. A120]|nr:unnamed protein product [Amoebophrya sp. A120]|eukprot:GSA120T00002944001.1